MFPQIATIIQGTLLTFLPKIVIFSSKYACISSNILSFLPNNPVCFYNKNSKKLNFSSNCAYNTGQFIDFSPKKKLFFPQNAPAYRALFGLFFPIIQCAFTPKLPKKSNFPQIATIIQGTLLTFLPKK